MIIKTAWSGVSVRGERTEMRRTGLAVRACVRACMLVCVAANPDDQSSIPGIHVVEEER